MKLDPCCQQQEDRPRFLDSSDAIHMGHHVRRH